MTTSKQMIEWIMGELERLEVDIGDQRVLEVALHRVRNTAYDEGFADGSSSRTSFLDLATIDDEWI